jgi:hypothetical protein
MQQRREEEEAEKENELCILEALTANLEEMKISSQNAYVTTYQHTAPLRPPLHEIPLFSQQSDTNL